MKPVRRMHVSKGRSARHFRHQVGRTARRNVAPMPMRGGFRL